VDFSDELALDGPAALSPAGSMLCTCELRSVVVRDAGSLQVVHAFKLEEPASLVSWAPDETAVAVLSAKSRAVNVFDLVDTSNADKARAVLDGGVVGTASLAWSRESSDILTFNAVGSGAIMWNLEHQKGTWLPFAKPQLHSFCPQGSFLALIQRQDCTDRVAIFTNGIDSNQGSWLKCAEFSVGSHDIAGLEWSPDGSYIAVWDSPRVYHLQLFSPSGERVREFCAYDTGMLGIKDVRWSPDGRLIAVTSFDGALRIINATSWKLMAVFEHPTSLSSSDDALVYLESRAMSALGGTPSSHQGLFEHHFAIPSLHDFVQQEALLDFGNEEQSVYSTDVSSIIEGGILQLGQTSRSNLGTDRIRFAEFDSRGQLIASVHEKSPHCVWIWSLSALSLAALLVHRNDVTSIHWRSTSGGAEPREKTKTSECGETPGSPTSLLEAASALEPVPRLLIATGAREVFSWTPFGASCTPVPISDFCVGSFFAGRQLNAECGSASSGAVLLYDPARKSASVMYD